MDFKQIIKNLEDIGFTIEPDRVYIKISDARNHLWGGIKYFTGEDARWLPEYEQVAEWLSDNQGRGLLCLGNCGRGKSLICGKIMPILLNGYCKLLISCYNAQQMNADMDQVINKHLVYIDDIGTEGISIKFGERRMAFSELVDEAEKRGALLLLTTNLSIGELREKYGERTIDRLKAITKMVKFVGESLRK